MRLHFAGTKFKCTAGIHEPNSLEKDRSILNLAFEIISNVLGATLFCLVINFEGMENWREHMNLLRLYRQRICSW